MAPLQVFQKNKGIYCCRHGSTGLDQNSSEYAVCICAKDSSCPYDYELRQRLVDICSKIIYLTKSISIPSMARCSAALSAGWDIKTALIGPGVFASRLRKNPYGILRGDYQTGFTICPYRVESDSII